jgi:parallel beta-helix repeat protein
MALDNTSWGSRQGIRVNNASEVLISGNTLMRNENSGVYFLRESANGLAIGNTLYENAKGARWGSDSNDGMAIGNIAFDNHEAGISIESTSGARIIGNSLVNNGETQLLVLKTGYRSEGNCLATGAAEQLIAELSHTDRFASLTEYQEQAQLDLGSWEGECGALPDKIDVQALHAETTTYRDSAVRSLAEKAASRE